MKKVLLRLAAALGLLGALVWWSTRDVDRAEEQSDVGLADRGEQLPSAITQRPEQPPGDSHEQGDSADIAAEQATHGPGRLLAMRRQRGMTNAVLTLERDRLQFLQTLATPTAAQLAELEESRQTLAALEARLAQQNEDVDKFDVNAGPPSVLQGATVPVPTMLSALSDEKWAAFAGERLGHPMSDQTLASMRHELGLVSKQLAHVSMPEGVNSLVQEQFLGVIGALQHAETAQDKEAANATVADARTSFVRSVEDMAARAKTAKR